MMNKSEAINLVVALPVIEKFSLAAMLASNCGYKLIVENTKRSLKIKELIAYYKALQPRGWETIIEGLEALLK